MGNIFLGLNIGRSSLLTHQTALDVVGHNLANVQTDGYSRQRAEVAQGLPLETAKGSLGTGVDVKGIQRLQVGYLERQINLVMAQNGYDQAFVDGLNQLQTVLDEPSSEGLGNALSSFWNSWEALSARPSDSGLRAQVLDSAENLATVFNQKTQGLLNAEVGFDEALSEAVLDVNSLAAKVASLNSSIAAAEASGHPANDLRDQRSLLAKQISEEIGLEVESDGSYLNLRLQGQEAYLVNRGQAFRLGMGPANGGTSTTIRMGQLEFVPIGGQIGALLRLRNDLSPGLRGELSSLVATVADRVNDLHAAGYDAYGPSGRNLFNWQGEATSWAYAPSSGVVSVSADSALEPGTHHLAVAAVDRALVSSGGATDNGQIILAQTGDYDGPLVLNQEYYVKVNAANKVPGSLEGLQVQLFRGDEAVGDPKAVSDASPAVSWLGVDGVDFSATISLGPGGMLGPGQRSDGYATAGSVSLDGGASQPTALLQRAAVTLVGGAGSGFTAGGAATVLLSDGVFFGASFTRYGAGAALVLNPEVARDENRVAAGAVGADGSVPSSGNGELARRIAELATQSIFEDLRETASGYLARTVQSLGSEARDAQISQKATGSVLTQLEAQQQSVSGVNVDEEMVQLLQFQRGFQAAARFVTTVDEMIDTLVNRVGLVGR